MADDTVNMPVAAVRLHAGSVDGVAHTVGVGRDAANHVHLGTEAYGQLCQFLPALLEPVSVAVLSALQESVTALEETGAKLRAAATAAETTDVRNATTVTATRTTVNLPL